MISLAVRPPSSVLLPASILRGQQARVSVGAGYGDSSSSTSSSSSSTSTTEMTTNESGLVSKLPLYALYVVIAGVIYYVGYKIIAAAWASKAGKRVDYIVR